MTVLLFNVYALKSNVIESWREREDCFFSQSIFPKFIFQVYQVNDTHINVFIDKKKGLVFVENIEGCESFLSDLTKADKPIDSFSIQGNKNNQKKFALMMMKRIMHYRKPKGENHK